jgi:hypothetical protein
MLNVTLPNGSVVPAAFTSEARLAAFFGAGTGYLRMNGKAMFEIFANVGMILNPGSSYGVHWPPDALAFLLGRPARRTIAKDTRVMLGTPAKYPDALIDRLRALLLPDPHVEEAWLALAAWPETQDQTWYLDIRSQAAADAVVAPLGELLKETNLDGHPLDVVVSAPGSGSGHGIRIKPIRFH